MLTQDYISKFNIITDKICLTLFIEISIYFNKISNFFMFKCVCLNCF